MKVTVCELHDERGEFERDWARLVDHVKAQASQLVLLPEMPFSPWFMVERAFSQSIWDAAVAAHERAQAALAQLAPAVVVSTRPVNVGTRRWNQGFLWEAGRGTRPAHSKYYLPDEEGFWEASWYGRGDGEFKLETAGEARIGFIICSELWFLERARAYGRAGANLVVTPRATERSSVEKWLMAGRVAAIVSGAFSLSSNRVGSGNPGFGGTGWVIGPGGEVLGTTSAERPFVTVDVDLGEAERARGTYPRYVLE